MFSLASFSLRFFVGGFTETPSTRGHVVVCSTEARVGGETTRNKDVGQKETTEHLTPRTHGRDRQGL